MVVNRVKQFAMTALATCVVFFTSTFVGPKTAHADHGLVSAASEYREAALGLERHIYRLGHVDHYVKRLVSRLENAACDFKAACHDPGNVSRLNYQWDELKSLHLRVEQALVTSCAADDPGLRQCWMIVTQSLQCVQAQMQYLCGGLPSTPVPPWQSQRVPNCGSQAQIGQWYGQAPNWNSGIVPQGMGRPGTPAPYPPISGPIVLPATPFGTTLGTIPFPDSMNRPYQNQATLNRPQLPSQSPSRGDVGAAIAIGLLQTLLNR